MKIIVMGWLFAYAAFAQSPTLVFNNGQPYSLSMNAGTSPNFSQSPVSLTSAVPATLLIAVQNTPWLSVGVVQPGGACDETVQYVSQAYAQFVTTDTLLCFQVNSSGQSMVDPNYLAQGWYTGYLKVSATGIETLLPISLQVVPSGYLHLQDINGNSLDGSSATLDTTVPGGFAIFATINQNATADNGAPAPAETSFTFSAQDATSGLVAPWLIVSDSGGAAISSPQSTPVAFLLSVDPSKIPLGATSLSADFVVKSTNGFQDTSTVRVVSAIPTLPALRIVSAASLVPGLVARGSIATVFGTDLANSTQSATSNPLPTNLNGTTVTITDSSGATVVAPLFYISPTQVNFLFPNHMADGAASMTVTSGDGQSTSGNVTIVSVAPGLFVVNPNGLVAANVLTIDGSGNRTYSNTFQVTNGSIVSLPVYLGPTQQVFLGLYGTGLANRSSLSNVTVQIGNVTALPVFAGPQGEAGLDQVNVLVPASLAGLGDTTLTVTVDGITSNVTRLTIE